MNDPLTKRLLDALAGTPLATRLETTAAAFLADRSGDAALTRLSDATLAGLARVVASQRQTANFLSHRPELLERIAEAGPKSLDERAQELQTLPAPDGAEDLEAALDALRIMRHEETCLAACLDLGEVVPFRAASAFLSVLAETITNHALSLASQSIGGDDTLQFAVLGMGKIAGREFTYHSDLDLIFLYGGPAEAGAKASRMGQRMISYLGTMTGAGVAYEVDTRLRPSGHQGVLVTSFKGFRQYQLERAETWEHLALLRARAIAGDVAGAQQLLDEVREPVLAQASPPWEYVAELRQRVEDERAKDGGAVVSLKTGPGGLMDVDFLASGALLERSAPEYPSPPSVPAMLRAVADGPAVDALIDDYAHLRLVESRARWLAGRGVEEVSIEGEDLETWAALAAPGTAPETVASELSETCGRIRGQYRRVLEAGSIDALVGSSEIAS